MKPLAAITTDMPSRCKVCTDASRTGTCELTDCSQWLADVAASHLTNSWSAGAS
jgi:hypothetical protein